MALQIREIQIIGMATLSTKWYLLSVLSSNVLKAGLNLLYFELLIGKQFYPWIATGVVRNAAVVRKVLPCVSLLLKGDSVELTSY